MGPAADSEQVATILAFGSFYRAMIEPALPRNGGAATHYAILDEIARRGTVEIVALRGTVRIDPGYLSRLLARMAASGLVVVSPSARDRRRRTVTITDRGRTQCKAARSQYTERVCGLLAGLAADDQRRIIAAMRTIRDALENTAPPDHDASLSATPCPTATCVS
jgi:DNA-binding MarR family transcriptional regulator